MTEVDTEEKSEESTSEPEQIEKEEKDEIVPAENSETDVIDNAGDTTPDTSSEKKGSSEKTPEGDADAEISSGEINAAEATEASVEVITLVDAKDAENKDILATSNASDVEVTFTNGCVNDGKLVAGKDLTFKIEPGVGRVLDKWGYVLSGDKSQDPKAATALTHGTELKIPNGTLLPKGKEAQSVKIYVKTKAATYDVGFTGDNADVYEIVSEGDNAGKLKKDKVAANAKFEITHGEFKEFAVVVADAKILDEDGIKLNNTTVDHEEAAEFDQVDSTEKVSAFKIEVDPSAYGLGSNNIKTEAAVSITVRDAYQLSVTDVAAPANAALKVHSGTDTSLVKMAANGKFTTTDLTEDKKEEYAEKSLAFAVKPAANYMITSVTAEVTDSKGAKADVEVSEGSEVTEDGDNKGNIEYTISLDQTALELTDNKTVSITIETALDDSDENDAIHRISFEAAEGSDLRNVTVKGTPKGGTEETLTDLTKTVRITEDDYTIEVTANAGYALTKGDKGEGGNLDADNAEEAALDGKAFVTISETRKYGSGEDVITPDPIVYKTEAAAAGIKINLKGSDTKYEDGAETAKSYVVLSATVTIGVSEIKNTDEKLIAFVDGLGTEDKASYTITNTAGVLKDEYAPSVYASLDNTYAIAKSVDLLTFSVTSANTPEVKLSIDATESTLKPLTSEGGVYTYSVPTNRLTEDTGKVNKIVIAKELGAEKTVSVNIDKAANLESTTGFVYKVDGTAKSETLSNGDNTLTNKAKVGQEVELVFTAAKNVTFGEIVATMGEEALTATTGKDEDGLNTATIKTVVKDAITVSVKTNAPYYVELSTAAESSLVQEEDGSYTVNYNETNILVDLKAADTGVDAAFYDIAVKDGSATAVTSAKIDGNSAKIEKIDPKEWGKTLTIEVQRTQDKAEKYSATLKVSAASDQVTVTDLATGEVVKKDVPVNLRRDSQISFRIDPKSGANREDLKLEIRAAKENASATENKKAQDLFADGASVSFGDDGVVTLTAKPGEAAADAVKLCVLNKEKGAEGKVNDKPLEGGEITINITDPVVKSADLATVTATEASSSNRKVKLNLNVNPANKKALIDAPIMGELFYRVEIKTITPDIKEGKVEVIKGNDLVKYVPIYKNGSTYSASDFAKYVEFAPIAKYTDKDNKVVDLNNARVDIPGTIAVTAEVTLVQSYASNDEVDGEFVPALVPASKDTAYAKGATASASLSTRRPVFETKLSVKKVNNATVFSGQTAVVAIPTFSKDTSYNEAYTEFVNTKTGKLLGNPWKASNGTDLFDTWVEGGNVYVYVNESVRVSDWTKRSHTVYDDSAISSKIYEDDFKNLGVKIVAPAPEEGYEATAVVKLNVKQGIYKIDANRSKAALTQKLYQDAKGTVKSVKITPEYNNGNSSYKPAKAAVTWQITDEYGYGTDSLDANIKMAIAGKKPLIKVKNGTVSVDKKFVRKANAEANTFYVTAKANDFAGNEVKKTFTFVITGKNQTIGKLVVVDGSNKSQPAASLKAEDFRNKSLYVAAVKPGVDDSAKNFTYNPATDFVPVTFKASGKLVTVGAADASNYRAPLTFYKKGKTKITATTVDGGKGAGTQATLDLVVADYEQLGLKLVSSSGVTTEPDNKTIKYFGGSNERYALYLHYYDSADKKWKPDYNYKNVKIKVDGGKFVANPDWKTSDNLIGWAVVVNKASGEASVTVTDTASKKETKYTIGNGSNATVKAPSVKLVEPNKLTADDYEDLKFQVKTSDKKLENYAGQYVKITPDYTLTRNKNYGAWDILGYNSANGYKEDKVGVIEKIDENGQFTLEDVNLQYTGTYKLVATVGDLDKGEFKALAKDAKVSLKVANRKYDGKLKVTSSYKLNEKGAAIAQIQVKTDSLYYVGGAQNITKQAKELGDAHSNNFTKYFEVINNWSEDNDDFAPLWNKTADYDGNYAYIKMKDDLSAADIAYITGQVPETAKQAKEDCEGYITVWNGTYRTDVKIKISFSKSVKYSATAPAVYASAKAVKLPVEIYYGKTKMDIAYAELDGTNSFTAKQPVLKDGQITLESVANLAASNKPYEVKLKVLPYAAAYNADTKDTNEKGAAKVKDLVATYGVPVTLKVTVKELGAAKMISANMKVSLSSAAYTEKNGNGYVQAASGKGNYVVNIPYTIAADNGALASKDPVAVKLEGNEIGSGKDKMTLVTASAKVVDKYNGNDVVGTQNVIQLTVSKQAIEYYSGLAKKDKPITGWGKKLKVPVTVQLTNANKENAALETLNFEITMPKQPKTFKDVQDIVKNAGIEKYQTAKAAKASVILTSLMDKITAKLNSIIPADSDVKVESLGVTGVKPDKGSASTAATAIVEEGTAIVTVKLKDVANKDAEAFEHSWTYNKLGVKATTTEVGDVKTATTVKNAIDTFLDSYEVKNETTAEILDTDIRSAEVDDIKNNIGDRRGNVSIKITKFVKVPATTKADGLITVSIQVKDLLNGTVAPINNKELTISRLQNIVNAYGKIKTAVTGANLTTIIQDCGSDPDLINTEILKAAQEAAKNPGITVAYKTDSFKFVKAIAVGGEDEEGVTLEDGRKGSLAFTLLITENGREKELDGSAEIQISDASKYVTLEEAKEKVFAKVAEDNDGTTVVLASLATALASAIDADETEANNKETIKNAVKAEAEKAVDGTTAGSVYGYEVEVTDIVYTLPTAAAKATVAFNVVVKSKKGTDSETIEVTETKIGTVDATRMTKEEFENAWKEMEAAISGGLPTNKAAALTEIGNKAQALVSGTQAGELKGAATYEAKSEATPTTDADSKVTALTGVTVVIKDSEGTVIYTTETAKDFTFAS